jgi:hypothetical protein
LAISCDSEILEENKKIRRLRLMADLTCALLARGDLNREDSWKLVEGVKHWALTLFPGKEEAFEIIYRPRFRRIIEKHHPLH